MSQPPKVVLFVDADATLSQQVGGSLRRHGLSVELLSDGNDLMARREAPSLIILCIDPPKPSGWSLVSRLKKSPVLKVVPLIVTSAEATEADFDAHRKLQVRADHYLRKPYPNATLLEKVGDFTGGFTVDVSDDDEDLIIDLEPGQKAEAPAPAKQLHLDEKDTDAVLAALDVSDGGAAAAPAAAGSAAGTEPPPPAPVPVAAEVTRPVPVPVPPQIPAPPRPPAVVGGGDEVAKLREERDRFKRELDEERAKPRAASQSGTSGPVGRDREVLTLREVINKKEKELLGLRAALDAKDREILDHKSRVRELESAGGDVDERLIGFERELVEVQERNEALSTEKLALQQEVEGAMRAAEQASNELAELQAKTYNEVEQERREAAMQLAGAEAKRAEAEKLANSRAAEVARREEAISEAMLTHAKERERLERELEEAVRTIDERRTGEMLELRREHQQTVAAFEERHRVSSIELQAAQAENAQLQGRIQREESSVTRARKALAIAITLLENGTSSTGSGG